MSPLFAKLPPFSSSSGGPSLVVVIHSHHPRPTRRPPTRTGCQQNVALPPAHASPLSAGCDAIRPPRCCHCRHRAAISAVVRPRYPSGADHRQARQRVRRHRRHQHRPLPLLPAAGVTGQCVRGRTVCPAPPTSRCHRRRRCLHRRRAAEGGATTSPPPKPPPKPPLPHLTLPWPLAM